MTPGSSGPAVLVKALDGSSPALLQVAVANLNLEKMMITDRAAADRSARSSVGAGGSVELVDANVDEYTVEDNSVGAVGKLSVTFSEVEIWFPAGSAGFCLDYEKGAC